MSGVLLRCLGWCPRLACSRLLSPWRCPTWFEQGELHHGVIFLSWMVVEVLVNFAVEVSAQSVVPFWVLEVVVGDGGESCLVLLRLMRVIGLWLDVSVFQLRAVHWKVWSTWSSGWWLM